MIFIKNIFKTILPERIIRWSSGLLYGWHGNYLTWDEAQKECTGYNSLKIIEKVRSSALKVKTGTVAYERDSFIFDSVQYAYPVLSALMWVAAIKKGKLNVLDFGGSLGSSYFQNKQFLDTLTEINWCVVEQPGFVDAGLKDFATDRLHFFYGISECIKTYNIDVILLSSVLQYLEKPYGFLKELLSLNIGFIIIDRTPFIKGRDRITVQKVNPEIYPASYPCWFFNKDSFVKFIGEQYTVITEFDSIDKANIKSEFRGFLLRKSA
jgi:putative methyltransferase (TIGR04325 family)